MKRLLFTIVTLLLFGPLFSQKLKTENLIVITLDGMRWQEIFGGVDSVLLSDKGFTGDSADMRKKFWAIDAEGRRKKLLPFFWNTIAVQGQVYGNRKYDNKVNNANRYWFSYPGYNEIFTGYPDTAVNSNDKKPNKNENVLEFLNHKSAFKGKIAAFTSWDVFDAILNEQRSGFLVSSGIDRLPETVASTPALRALNDMQMKSTQPLGESIRMDMITYYLAKEYLRQYQPRVLYIGFDETDDYAHQGKYDNYLLSAHLTDKWLEDLWDFVQSIPKFKGKTTFLITTDHGRGDKEKKQWTSHGENIAGASEIWLAVMGPDTKALGEVRQSGQLYQEQIAATIAALLGTSFITNHPVGKIIPGIITR
jgi:hypothetical protein